MAESSNHQHQTIIGARIRSARMKRGWSVRELADRISNSGYSIGRSTLLNIEHGRSVAKSEFLILVAKILDVSLLDLGAPERAALSGRRFRALKSVTKTEERVYLEDAARWIGFYLELDSIVNNRIVARSVDCKSSTTAIAMAKKAREALGISEAFPIPSVSRALEEFGVRTIQLPSESRIDAFAANTSDGPVVVVNPNSSEDRLRLTMAHELGHVLFEDCLSDRVPTKEEEDRAFEFASHFLLPESRLFDAFDGKSMVRLVQYKERFGISMAAMVFRARRLNILSRNEYEWIWKEFARRGWRTDEPGVVKPDRPLRFEYLVDVAENTRSLNVAGIANEFGISRDNLDRRRIYAIGAINQETGNVTAERNSFRINDYFE